MQWVGLPNLCDRSSQNPSEGAPDRAGIRVSEVLGENLEGAPLMLKSKGSRFETDDSYLAHGRGEPRILQKACEMCVADMKEFGNLP